MCWFLAPPCPSVPNFSQTWERFPKLFWGILDSVISYFQNSIFVIDSSIKDDDFLNFSKKTIFFVLSKQKMLHFSIFANIFDGRFWKTHHIVQFPTSQNPKKVSQTFLTPVALWDFQPMCFTNKYDQSWYALLAVRITKRLHRMRFGLCNKHNYWCFLVGTGTLVDYFVSRNLRKWTKITQKSWTSTHQTCPKTTFLTRIEESKPSKMNQNDSKVVDKYPPKVFKNSDFGKTRRVNFSNLQI